MDCSQRLLSNPQRDDKKVKFFIPKTGRTSPKQGEELYQAIRDLGCRGNASRSGRCVHELGRNAAGRNPQRCCRGYRRVGVSVRGSDPGCPPGIITLDLDSHLRTRPPQVVEIVPVLCPKQTKTAEKERNGSERR